MARIERKFTDPRQAAAFVLGVEYANDGLITFNSIEARDHFFVVVLTDDDKDEDQLVKMRPLPCPIDSCSEEEQDSILAARDHILEDYEHGGQEDIEALVSFIDRCLDYWGQ